jgi:hypothetical protein
MGRALPEVATLAHPDADIVERVDRLWKQIVLEARVAL